MGRRPKGAAAAARLGSSDPRVRLDAAFDLLRSVLADAPPAATETVAEIVVPALVDLANRVDRPWIVGTEAQEGAG